MAQKESIPIDIEAEYNPTSTTPPDSYNDFPYVISIVADKEPKACSPKYADSLGKVNGSLLLGKSMNL